MTTLIVLVVTTLVLSAAQRIKLALKVMLRSVSL